MTAAANTAGATLAREYESVFILRPDIDSDGLEKNNTRVAGVIDKNGGHLVKVEVWGKRKLAYKIRHEQTGVYCVFRFLGSAGLVAELERNFRMWDNVIKFLTVKLEDEVDVEERMKAVLPDEVSLRRELVDQAEEDQRWAPAERRDSPGGRPPGPPSDQEEAASVARAAEAKKHDQYVQEDDGGDELEVEAAVVVATETGAAVVVESKTKAAVVENGENEAKNAGEES